MALETKRADQLVDGDVIVQPLNGLPVNSVTTGKVLNTVAVDNGIQINFAHEERLIVADDDLFEIEVGDD